MTLTLILLGWCGASIVAAVWWSRLKAADRRLPEDDTP